MIRLAWWPLHNSGAIDAASGVNVQRRTKVRAVDCKARIRLFCIRLNIGATKTYRMIKEHVKELENIGATLNHFKNFQRDMKCFIHERDGQLMIDRFKSVEENVPDFFFDYDVDEDGSLRCVIWADGVGRKNYQLFGEAISFDPTYSTNKYSMVFTPFTGVDNHKRNCPYPFVESAAVVDNLADDNGKRVDEV